MGDKAWAGIIGRLWIRITGHGNDRAFEAGRTKAATAIELFATILIRYLETSSSTGESRELINKIQAEVKQMVQSERSPVVLRILDPAAASLLQI
jgi:hypothetical protein